MASIKVAVRVRPCNKREKDMGCSSIIRMEKEMTSITNFKLPTSGSDSLGRERIKQFTYDHSYWSCNREDPDYASQQKIYDDLGDGVVKAAYQGYNACVFAYGQTGSGKTYTMMGAPEKSIKGRRNEEDCGLIPRICESLFIEMEDTEVTYKTEVSYLEIYNERVRDLLREKKQAQMNLKVREHPKDGPYVQDLSRHLVLNYTDVEDLIARGNNNRTTAATNMNDHSSRSHAIFTIFFTQAKIRDNVPSEFSSKIHLVDLAGSERADSAGTKGDRLKEGGSINKSLVTLGNVISTLADLADRGSSSHRGVFIPYRDSVITWLLKDSLGGNAKTIMIATISPADCFYAETLSTLRYANRAKRIINKPMVNEDPNVKLIRELRAENAHLRSLLGQNVDLPTNKAKLSRNEAKVRQLTEKWTDKWQEAANVLQEHNTLALRSEGMGVVLDSELPYLLAIDDNILTTGMRLYHLQEGDTRVGREDAGSQDIVLSGPHIEAQHCIFHHAVGEVQLIPLEAARCSVNSNRIHEATKLSQGAIIRLGKRHTFRFNHPGEAAKMREELHAEGTEQLIQVWKDFQWSWSNQSINDSALGSDLELEPRELVYYDEEKLDERRRQIESLEQEHCLAEAQRLSREVEQEGKAQHLLQKEEELLNLSLKADSMREKAEKAQDEIRRLTAAFEVQFGDELVQQRRLQTEEERLLAEEKRIKNEQEKLLHDKARAREERQRLRKQRAKEREELQLAQERQQEEWEEIKGEKHHLQRSRRQQQQEVEKHKAKIEAQQKAEQETYQKEMASMRQFVDQEVQDMRRQAGLPEDPDLKMNGQLMSDDELDLSEYQLNLESPLRSPADTGPVLPMQYLEQSPSMNHVPEAEPVVLEELSSGSANEKLDYLSSQVLDIHVQVCEALHRKYNSVLSSDDTTGGLTDHVITQFANLKPAFEQLERLAKSHSLDEAGVSRLQDYDRQLATVDRFLQVHNGLEATERTVRAKQFTSAVKHLEGLQTQLATHEAEDQTELNVHKVLSTEACIQRERLLYELGETWNTIFRWTLPLESRRLAGRPRTVTLEVGEPNAARPLVTSTAQAMQATGLLESRLRMLTDRLMQNLVEPVVQDRNTLLQVVEETDKYILCVVRNPAGSDHQTAVPPAEAFQKLEQIFTFIHEPIAEIMVPKKPPDKTLQLKPSIKNSGATSVVEDSENNVNLSEKLGQLLCKQLFQCVYNECLSHSIPRNSRQFDRFNEIVQLTEEFQESLSRLGFLAPQESTLMDYLNNVNSLFANIKSQEILRQAHQFMTQELLHSIQISSDHPLGTPGKGAVTAEKEAFVNSCRIRVGTSNYKLPTCQISVPVSSLVCLSYGTLGEAFSTSQEGALTLCHSLRNMFELYCDVVPSYHKEKLNSMPLLAALHHNNCMFVAHHLITLDKSFATKMATLELGRDPQLGELVSKVRTLGNQCFTLHINVKKQQLEEHLAAAEGFSCIADDEGAGAKNAIRHMLNHLKHISSIWKSVLPTNVFFKAVGTLLNAALGEILDSVLGIEEFSAEDCEYLHDVLAKVTDVAPEFFRVEEVKANPQVALHEHVAHWMKFRELVIVLKSSMQDVADRWSDGKGPLALYFTAEEVQKLVVAMFENTSKRDSLLAQLR